MAGRCGAPNLCGAAGAGLAGSPEHQEKPVISTAALVRSTALVATGAAITLPLSAGFGPLPAGPFIAGPVPAAAAPFAQVTGSAGEPAGDAHHSAPAALRSAARGSVGSTSAAADVAHDTRTATTVTAGHAPSPAAQSPAAQSPQQTGTAAPTSAANPVETVRQPLTGSVQACPGAPASAGVQVQRGDVLTLRVRPVLRTPSATTRTVREAVEVSLPDPRALLEDPASAQVSPGGTTGASVHLPVVDRALAQTTVRATAPEPERVREAAEQDVTTVRSGLPSLRVHVGTTTTEVTASTWVSTAAAAGALSFDLTGREGTSCTTVTWSLAR